LANIPKNCQLSSLRNQVASNSRSTIEESSAMYTREDPSSHPPHSPRLLKVV
jgi:hypothetical protein